MDMIDAVASLVILAVLSYVSMLAWERLWPSDKSAEELGYIPESEAPAWGWLPAIALGLAAIGLLVFGPTVAARMIGI